MKRTTEIPVAMQHTALLSIVSTTRFTPQLKKKEEQISMHKSFISAQFASFHFKTDQIDGKYRSNFYKQTNIMQNKFACCSQIKTRNNYCMANNRLCWKSALVVPTMFFILRHQSKICVCKKTVSKVGELKLLFNHSGYSHATSRIWNRVLIVIIFLSKNSSNVFGVNFWWCEETSPVVNHCTKWLVMALRTPGMCKRNCRRPSSTLKSTRTTHRNKTVFRLQRLCLRWCIGCLCLWHMYFAH